MNWYKLNPSATNPHDPSNYSLNNDPGCSGSDTLCAINASDDGFGNPVISGDIHTAIDNALSGIITPGVTLLKTA